jgi:hypothetical protein
MAVGVVAAVGVSAAAVAVMPGDNAGEVQVISAIAAPSQDAAEGTVTNAVTGGEPEVVAPPAPVELGTTPDPEPGDSGDDAGADPSDSEANPGDDASGDIAASDSESGDDSGSNSGHGPGSSEAKDAEKAAKDAEKAQKKADKEAKKAAEKAAKDAEKAQKKADRDAKKAAKDAEKAKKKSGDDDGNDKTDT